MIGPAADTGDLASPALREEHPPRRRILARSGARQCLPASARTAPGAPLVTAEVVDLPALQACDADWRALAQRAEAPNPFMDPAFLAAAPQATRRAIRVVLAWMEGPARRLVGCWALKVRRPTLRMPFAVLAAPAIDKYAFLGGPVVDRDHVAEALRAMLDAIADDARLPNAVVVDALGNDGAVAETLSRLFAERAMPVVELGLGRRPMLRSDLDGPGYFRQAMSASTRKKLRQHRNRLSAQGALDLATYSDAADVARVLERFLQLEAAGWKGRAGTALLSDPADAAFAREAIVAMAERGAARIETLELDGRIVGAQVVLLSGRGAFTWKIAHDEAFAQYSPGTLLVEAYTAKMLADPATAFADSCSHGEDGMMASLWSERMSVRDLCFCARPGGSPGFRMVAGLILGERRLRRFAKRALAQTAPQRDRLRGLLRQRR